MGFIEFIGNVINRIDFYSRGQFDNKLKVVNAIVYTVAKTPSMFFRDSGVKRQSTIKELEILLGFHLSFNLFGTFRKKWGSICNSISSPLAFK